MWFCLRPKAKDVGSTWVVFLVVCGQRPRNYLSCSTYWPNSTYLCLPNYIYHFIYHFIIYTYLHLPTYLPIPTYLSLPTYPYLPIPTHLGQFTFIYFCLRPTAEVPSSMSTYHYLPTYVNLPTPTNLHQHAYMYQHTYLLMSTYQPMSTYHHLPSYLPLPTYINIPTYMNKPTYFCLLTNPCQPTIIFYLPLPILKYQYIIPADPGASIGLVRVM